MKIHLTDCTLSHTHKHPPMHTNFFMPTIFPSNYNIVFYATSIIPTITKTTHSIDRALLGQWWRNNNQSEWFLLHDGKYSSLTLWPLTLHDVYHDPIIMMMCCDTGHPEILGEGQISVNEQDTRCKWFWIRLYVWTSWLGYDSFRFGVHFAGWRKVHKSQCNQIIEPAGYNLG